SWPPEPEATSTWPRIHVPSTQESRPRATHLDEPDELQSHAHKNNGYIGHQDHVGYEGHCGSWRRRNGSYPRVTSTPVVCLRRHREGGLTERAKSSPCQAAFDVEAVLAVRIDVSSERGREMREVLVSRGDAISSQHIEHPGHVHGVPRDHGVGDQVEAEGLDGLVLVLCPADLSL